MEITPYEPRCALSAATPRLEHFDATVSGGRGERCRALGEAGGPALPFTLSFDGVRANPSEPSHGGPLAGPEDTQYVLDRTKGIAGFYGASSMERLPVEIAITENTKRFKQLKVC